MLSAKSSQFAIFSYLTNKKQMYRKCDARALLGSQFFSSLLGLVSVVGLP